MLRLVSLFLFSIVLSYAQPAGLGTPVRAIHGAASTAAWTSATGVDTALSLAVGNYCVVALTLRTTTTMTAGTLNFQASDDGTNWYTIALTRMDTLAIDTTYSLASPPASQSWQVNLCGYNNFRVRLNPVIAGTGTASLTVQGQAGASTTRVVAGLAAGTATIGTVLGNKSSTSSTAAQTAVGTTAGQILAALSTRKEVIIQNTGTTIIKLILGAGTPTQTVYHVGLKAASAADDGTGGTFVSDLWTGAIQAISSAAGGTCVVTEIQ